MNTDKTIPHSANNYVIRTHCSNSIPLLQNIYIIIYKAIHSEWTLSPPKNLN